MSQFLVLWISNQTKRGEPALRRSAIFDAPKEARHWAKAQVDNGQATLATVWTWDTPASPGRLIDAFPRSAERIILHYLDMARLAVDADPEDIADG